MRSKFSGCDQQLHKAYKIFAAGVFALNFCGGSGYRILPFYMIWEKRSQASIPMLDDEVS